MELGGIFQVEGERIGGLVGFPALDEPGQALAGGRGGPHGLVGYVKLEPGVEEGHIRGYQQRGRCPSFPRSACRRPPLREERCRQGPERRWALVRNHWLPMPGERKRSHLTAPQRCWPERWRTRQRQVRKPDRWNRPPLPVLQPMKMQPARRQVRGLPAPRGRKPRKRSADSPAE